MMYSDFYSRSDWDGAKLLWLSELRPKLNVGLPLPTFWELRDISNGWTSGLYTAAKKRREILDTGFCKVHFPDSAPQSVDATIDGFPNVPAYVKANELPYIVRIGGSNSTHKVGLGGAGFDQHPCYDGTNGQHIGSDAGTNPCGPGVANHISNAAYRFQAKGGVPLDPPGAVAGEFLVPILPETIGYWTACDDFLISKNPTYGDAVHKKLMGAPYGIPYLPVGATCDWEDYHRSWDDDATWRAKYSDDPRFGFAARTGKSSHRFYFETLATMIEARVNKLAELCPWVHPSESLIYDLEMFAMQYGSWASPLLRTNEGRKRGRCSAYVHYGAGATYLDFADSLSAIGNTLAISSAADVHCFMSLFASTQNFPTSGGTYPDKPGIPGAGQGVLSNAQCVGLARLMLFAGAVQIMNYNTASASQDLWAMLIAYQECQQYAELIKYGRNIVPPAAINRPYVRYDGTTFGQCRTVWYSKQFDGSDVPAGYFVCCRVHRGREYFFGITANAAGNSTTVDSVTVRSPSNQAVSVKVSPEGTITLAS